MLLVEPLDQTQLDGTPLLAVGRFDGPLQEAIHMYKYRGRSGLATDLGELLAAAVKSQRLPSLRALTFVPLHPARQRQRGYNQAERLAANLGRRLELSVVAGLVRTRATPAQVGLSQAERRENLLGAFAWRGVAAPPDGLGLVDDVCTTGATLEAAGAALRLAGGAVAAFLVVARAQTLPAPAVTFPGQSGWP